MPGMGRCSTPKYWGGSFPFAYPECQRASHLKSQGADSRFLCDKTENPQEKKPLHPRLPTSPPTTDSSWFFIPSLQSWVSQCWHYWRFRLRISLLWGTALYTVGWLAVSLASTHLMPVAPLPSSGDTTKCLQILQNNPPLPWARQLQLKTTSLKRSPRSPSPAQAQRTSTRLFNTTKLNISRWPRINRHLTKAFNRINTMQTNRKKSLKVSNDCEQNRREFKIKPKAFYWVSIDQQNKLLLKHRTKLSQTTWVQGQLHHVTGCWTLVKAISCSSNLYSWEKE